MTTRMRDYYLLGSKWYRNEEWEDWFPDMIRRKLLEVGWGGERGSFEELYGKSEVEIVDHLKKLGEPSGSYNTHKLFLNMRPGDWVAVKADGAPKGLKPNLKIQAYACVTQKNGHVYCFTVIAGPTLRIVSTPVS